MSRSRRMPPLFEVMRETTPARTPITPVPVTPPAAAPRPPAGPTPVVRSIPTPPQAAPPREPAPAAPRSTAPLSLRPPDPSPDDDEAPPASAASAAAGPTLDLNRPVVFPVKTLLIAASVAIALLILVWYFGWNSGAKAARREWVATQEADPNQVTPNVTLPDQDPLNTPSAPVQRPQQAAKPPVTTPRPTDPPPQPATQAPKPAAGAITDPRGTGLNYLWAETVTQLSDADGIVAFLEANGLPAVAVPKSSSDIATARAKDERGWEVVLLEGIPGNQYSARAARREELIRQVKALGKQLSQEGRSNFHLSSPSWKKY